MVNACLRESQAGVLLQVKAIVGAKKNEFRGIENGRLRVATAAPPEKGKANRAIGKLLAERLKLPGRDVELVRGETHSQKMFLLRGVGWSEASERLRSALGEGWD